MSCEEFRDRLMEYIEEELSSSDMEEMEKHMELCSECREAYEKRLELMCTFGEVLNDESISFDSRKSNIMDSIDKDKYKKPKTNRLKQMLVNSKRFMVQVAAAILILAIIPVVLKNTGVLGEKASMGNKSSSKDSAINGLENREEIGIESYPENNRQEGNALQIESSAGDDLSSRLAGLRGDSSLELRAWEIQYAGSDNIVFSSFDNIVVYSQLQNKVVSLIKIDALKMKQGLADNNLQLELRVSPDGKHALVGAARVQGQILLLNLISGSYEGAGSGSLANMKVSWSADSSFVVAYDKENRQLLIHNALQGKTKSLGDKLEESLENVYISNEGSVALQGKESYVLKAPDYSKGFLLLGKAVGFMDEVPLSIKEGTIYYNSERGTENFLTLQGNYENADFYQQGNKLFITSENISQALDLNTKTITEKLQLDKPEELGDADYNSKGLYIDEDTLVYISLIEEAKALGQFRIIKYSLKTGEKTVLYDNSK